VRRGPGALAARAGRAAWLLLLIGAPSASAHEYWLDPLDATIAPGDALLVSIRNGEDFTGSGYPYDPARFDRVELVGAQGRRALSGRLGDYPALRGPDDSTASAGLNTILLEAAVRPLGYDDLESFAAFLDYHGLRGIAARHAERGLPASGILERYSRHAKAFIDVQVPGQPRRLVDGGAQALAPQGMAYELVLEADPYAMVGDGQDTVVRALFQGRALPDVQIELFTRTAEAGVSRTVRRSDTQGRARFDTRAAADYLFNSVHLVETDEAGAHWRSYWAALTLERAVSIDGQDR